MYGIPLVGYIYIATMWDKDSKPQDIWKESVGILHLYYMLYNALNNNL